MGISRTEFFLKLRRQTIRRIKYNMHMIISLDAVNVTAGDRIDLLDEEKGSYVDCLKKVCHDMTLMYGHSICIYAVSDEVNLIVLDTDSFLKKFPNDHITNIDNVKDIILLEFYQMMSNQYKSEQPIRYRTNWIQIYKDSIFSYLIWRRHLGSNAMLYYFLKKKRCNMRDMNGKSYNELIKIAEGRYPDFKNRTPWQAEGVIFYYGSMYQIDQVIQCRKFEENAILYREEESRKCEEHDNTFLFKL